MPISSRGRLLSTSRIAVLLLAAFAVVNGSETEKSRKKRFCGVQTINDVQYDIPCAQPATCRRYEAPPPRAACPPPIIIVAPGFRPELRPQSFRPHNSYIRPQLQHQFVQQQPQEIQYHTQYSPVYLPQLQPYYQQNQPPLPVFNPQYQYPQQTNAYVTAPPFPVPNRPLPVGIRLPVSHHSVVPGGYATAPNQNGPRPVPAGHNVGWPKPGYNSRQKGGQGIIPSAPRRIVTTSPRPLKKVTPSSKKIHEENEDDLLNKQPPRPTIVSTFTPSTIGTTLAHNEIIPTTPFPEKHEHIDFTSGDDGEFGSEGGKPGQIEVDVAALSPGDGVPSSTVTPFAPNGQEPTGTLLSTPRTGGFAQGRDGLHGSEGDFFVPGMGPNEGERSDNFGSETSFRSGGEVEEESDKNENKIIGRQRGSGGQQRGQGFSTDRNNEIPGNSNLPVDVNSLPPMPPLDSHFDFPSVIVTPSDRTHESLDELGRRTAFPPSVPPSDFNGQPRPLTLDRFHQSSIRTHFPGGVSHQQRVLASSSDDHLSLLDTNSPNRGNGGFAGEDGRGSHPGFGPDRGAAGRDGFPRGSNGQDNFSPHNGDHSHFGTPSRKSEWNPSPSSSFDDRQDFPSHQSGDRTTSHSQPHVSVSKGFPGSNTDGRDRSSSGSNGPGSHNGFDGFDGRHPDSNGHFPGTRPDGRFPSGSDNRHPEWNGESPDRISPTSRGGARGHPFTGSGSDDDHVDTNREPPGTNPREGNSGSGNEFPGSDSRHPGSNSPFPGSDSRHPGSNSPFPGSGSRNGKHGSENRFPGSGSDERHPESNGHPHGHLPGFSPNDGTRGTNNRLSGSGSDERHPGSNGGFPSTGNRGRNNGSGNEFPGSDSRHPGSNNEFPGSQGANNGGSRPHGGNGGSDHRFPNSGSNNRHPGLNGHGSIPDGRHPGSGDKNNKPHGGSDSRFPSGSHSQFPDNNRHSNGSQSSFSPHSQSSHGTHPSSPQQSDTHTLKMSTPAPSGTRGSNTPVSTRLPGPNPPEIIVPASPTTSETEWHGVPIIKEPNGSQGSNIPATHGSFPDNKSVSQGSDSTHPVIPNDNSSPHGTFGDNSRDSTSDDSTSDGTGSDGHGLPGSGEESSRGFHGSDGSNLGAANSPFPGSSTSSSAHPSSSQSSLNHGPGSTHSSGSHGTGTGHGSDRSGSHGPGTSHGSGGSGSASRSHTGNGSWNGSNNQGPNGSGSGQGTNGSSGGNNRGNGNGSNGSNDGRRNGHGGDESTGNGKNGSSSGSGTGSNGSSPSGNGSEHGRKGLGRHGPNGSRGPQGDNGSQPSNGRHSGHEGNDNHNHRSDGHGDSHDHHGQGTHGTQGSGSGYESGSGRNGYDGYGSPTQPGRAPIPLSSSSSSSSEESSSDRNDHREGGSATPSVYESYAPPTPSYNIPSFPSAHPTVPQHNSNGGYYEGIHTSSNPSSTSSPSSNYDGPTTTHLPATYRIPSTSTTSRPTTEGEGGDDNSFARGPGVSRPTAPTRRPTTSNGYEQTPDGNGGYESSFRSGGNRPGQEPYGPTPHTPSKNGYELPSSTPYNPSTTRAPVTKVYYHAAEPAHRPPSNPYSPPSSNGYDHPIPPSAPSPSPPPTNKPSSNPSAALHPSIPSTGYDVIPPVKSVPSSSSHTEVHEFNGGAHPGSGYEVETTPVYSPSPSSGYDEPPAYVPYQNVSMRANVGVVPNEGGPIITAPINTTTPRMQSTTPENEFGLDGCYRTKKGLACCDTRLEEVLETALMEQLSLGRSKCNFHIFANAAQRAAEEEFGRSFESIAAPSDFGLKAQFGDNLMCKTIVDGKFVMVWATAVPYATNEPNRPLTDDEIAKLSFKTITNEIASLG